jgi:hypothetical protein
MPKLFKYYDIFIFGNYLHQYFVMNLGVDHFKSTKWENEHHKHDQINGIFLYKIIYIFRLLNNL